MTEQEEKTLLNAWLKESGFRFQGTDGVRGKVEETPLSDAEALIKFKNQNIITPGFLQLNCRAMGMVLQEQGILKSGDPVLFGEDGRDFYQKKILRNACIQGFKSTGLRVLDAGVLPTPALFIAAAYFRVRLGAILTASHNPSNQNGLKLFVDGYKLLPDESYGDYALSRRMAEEALAPTAAISSEVETEEVSGEARAVFYSTMMESARLTAHPGDFTLLYDTAHGAFSSIGPEILEGWGITPLTFNNSPDGKNINQNCGVAEIEGTEYFDGTQEASAAWSNLVIVKKLFELGRKEKRKLTAAIVHDGDGDRGFLLLYDAAQDRVEVLDGDTLAYVRAATLQEQNLSIKKEAVFTVESDLAVPLAISSQLKIPVKVVCVGDKWIVNEQRKGTPVLVAAESSGHVAEPIVVSGKQGNPVPVLCGNGLLSSFLALNTIVEKGMSVSSLRELYTAGVKKTYYTYFIDRSKFRKGSRAFLENSDLAKKIFSEWQAAGKIDRQIVLSLEEFSDDPDMLYCAFQRNGATEGACFVRNSGTEVKIGITIRGVKALEPFLKALALTLQKHHQENLKDPANPDHQREIWILKLLGEKNTGLSEEALLREVQEERREKILPAEWSALLYGLKKEGRIVINRGVITSGV